MHIVIFLFRYDVDNDVWTLLLATQEEGGFTRVFKVSDKEAWVLQPSGKIQSFDLESETISNGNLLGTIASPWGYRAVCE